jgi:hypothetical protein
VAVVAEHIAGDDQCVEIELIGARDAGQRARRASLIAGNRPLGAERSERDEVNVRTSPSSPVSNAPKSPTTGLSAAPST